MDVEWQKTKIDPQRDQSVDYVNKSDHVVIDNGAVPFGPATVMTGDGPAIHHLYKLTGNKWSNKDVELECGSGILSFNYLKANPVHSVQWAIGLELLLHVNDPWKTIITTDSPNGGPFTRYPQVITRLMSKKARDATFAECHKWAQDRSQERTYFTEPHMGEGLEKEMLKDVKEWFKYYTLGFANYPVPDKYIRNPSPVQVNKPLEAIVGR